MRMRGAATLAPATLKEGQWRPSSPRFYMYSLFLFFFLTRSSLWVITGRHSHIVNPPRPQGLW